MSKERLEEIAYNVGVSIDGEKALMSSDDYDFLYNYALDQAERVNELETTVDFYQNALRDADRRVQELEEEVDRLKVWYGAYHRETKTISRLRDENKRLREALEFYADKGTYEVVETLPPTDEYQQPIEPVFKTVPIIYYDKGKEARKALEGEK